MESDSMQAPALKGAIPECLDAASRSDNARQLLKNLQAGIESLRKTSFENLTDVFVKHLFTPTFKDSKRTRAIADYLEKHWFDASSDSAYFRDLQPIAPLYAEGILTTLKLSLRTRPKPTPIDAWWLLDHHGFELINLVSDRQITLLIATPRPGIFSKAKPTLGQTEVWTTKRSRIASVQFVRKPG
jgi:hypothetical protein